MKQVVALVGPKRCGKDSVAEIMCRAQRYERFTIATQLKEGLRALYPELSMEDLESETKDSVHPALGCTPRALMQAIGTDVTFQNIGASYWINSAIRRIRESPVDRVVVTDVRFPHEEKALREAFPDMRVIRILRPDAVDREDRHASETAHLGVRHDAVIHNTGTLRDLVWKVTQALRGP